MPPTDAQHGPGVLRIFISYRRQDAPSYARELHHELSRHFSDSQIFWDIKMELGVDFVEEIERAVGSCDVLVAVVGPHWLDLTDDQGRRRIDDPSDFVRLEIATALERGVRVIPVLVQGAAMPAAEALPEPLRRLSRRNAMELSDKRWDYDVGELIASLERVPHQKLIPPTGRGTFPGDEPATSAAAAASTPTAPLEPVPGRSAGVEPARAVLASNVQRSPSPATAPPAPGPGVVTPPLLAYRPVLAVAGGLALLLLVGVLLIVHPWQGPATAADQGTPAPAAAGQATKPATTATRPGQVTATSRPATATTQPQATPRATTPATPRATATRPAAPTAASARNYADELTDFGVAPLSVLQTDDRIGTATPMSIPGGSVVTTTDLVDAIKRGQTDFVLIDALGGSAHATIPGAHAVPDAGLSGSFTDTVQQKLSTYYRSLTNGRFDAVMVFFCQGSRCWESYNASLRAIHMGYSNVYWYRGGLSAWQAAGLDFGEPASF